MDTGVVMSLVLTGIVSGALGHLLWPAITFRNALKVVCVSAMTGLAVIWLAGCTSPESATRTLQQAGFTEIQTTGYAGPFSCGRDDVFSTGFTAMNPQGAKVEGVVCCGWMKLCTVRF